MRRAFCGRFDSAYLYICPKHGAIHHDGTVSQHTDAWSFQIGRPSGISVDDPTGKLVVYPNPAAERVFIVAPEGRTIVAVELHALSGRLISRQPADSLTNHSLSLRGIGDV